jgi:hypothetical protein
LDGFCSRSAKALRLAKNGFDPAQFDDLFKAMKAAGGVSLLAMCLMLPQHPVELAVAEEAEDAAIDFM